MNKYDNDFYSKKAKQLGFRARSYFKLEEIDNRFKLIKNGQSILDLGASPGSWLQYCLNKTQGHCSLMGVDLKPIAPFSTSSQQARTKITLLQEDVFSIKNYPKDIDIILSDMAPNTTGVHSVDAALSAQLVEEVLKISTKYLKKGGSVLVKYLQGEDQSRIIKLYKTYFSKVKVVKPKSSRSFSTEVFLLGQLAKNDNLGSSASF